ncbi:hypothetical protein Tco_1441952, partial [Tanacetum coccineum]
ARCQPLGEHFKLSKKQVPMSEASRRRMAKFPYASVVGSLMYAMRKEVVLEGFSDSDYEGCLDSGKSTTGYVFIVGGTTVSWMSRIQKCVSMSTTEAEYMAIAEADKELCYSSREESSVSQLDETHQDKISLSENCFAQLQLAFEITNERRPMSYQRERKIIPSLMMLAQDTLYRKSPSPAFGYCSVFRMFSGTGRLEQYHCCREDAKGPRLQAEGFDVDLTKRSSGRTLLTQKLLGILILSKAKED